MPRKRKSLISNNYQLNKRRHQNLINQQHRHSQRHNTYTIEVHGQEQQQQRLQLEQEKDQHISQTSNEVQEQPMSMEQERLQLEQEFLQLEQEQDQHISQPKVRTSAYKRTTDKQYSLLTREMAKYSIDTRQGKNKKAVKYWMDLTDRLNSLGPPFRTPPQWKKVWTDFRRFHSKRDNKSQPKFIKSIKSEPNDKNDSYHENEEYSQSMYKPGMKRTASPDDDEIMNFEQNSLSMHSTFSNDCSEQYSSYTERNAFRNATTETLIPDQPSFSSSSFTYAEDAEQPPRRQSNTPTASLKTHHQPPNTHLMDQTFYTLQNQMENQTKLLEHLSQITSSMACLMERQVLATEKQTEAIRRQASATEHHTLVMNSFVDMIREKMPKTNIKTSTTNLSNGDL